MVATIKDPMDDSVEDGSDAGEGSSDEENLSDGFETVQRSGRSGGYGDEEPDFSDPEGFVDDPFVGPAFGFRVLYPDSLSPSKRLEWSC